MLLDERPGYGDPGIGLEHYPSVYGRMLSKIKVDSLYFLHG